MDWTESVRARIGRRLERGAPSTPLLRIAANAWAASVRIARPLAIPRGLDVVGIGSAVLGGAGKTPLAIATALELASFGARVALVSHAYRASPGRARIVTACDAVSEVGDDALAAARSLDGTRVDVIVGPTREGALALASARGAEVVVVDGLLQASPRRLAASVLALDGATPWGAGACPPLGDLRASRAALVAASDLIAVLRNPGDPDVTAIDENASDVPSRVVSALTASRERVALHTLADRRVGLLLAIARPERVTAALARQGISVALALLLADHARFSPSALLEARDAEVDIWLTTARCATKLPASIRGVPVLALEHEVDASALAVRIMNRLGQTTRPPC